jgi:hypothetical protein
MLNRIKLAFSIITGKSIIIYLKSTKTILAMINGNEDILENQIDYVVDKYIVDNNGQPRYLKRK